MKRELHLTSPLMRGSDVRYAQRLLFNNVFKTRFLKSGERAAWDEVCAAAVRQAKWELGYPERGINGRFGSRLERYLHGNDKLPLLHRRRRTNRLKRDLGNRALAEARRWLGSTETPPGSNIALPFTLWYGWRGWGAPWCAVFVSYCLQRAGSKAVKPSEERWAYCPYVVRDARAGRYGLRQVSWLEARAGDLVLFDWDNDGIADHIGFFDRKVGVATFSTVEGNTSPDNFSNGGKVVHYNGKDAPLRNIRDVLLFARVES